MRCDMCDIIECGYLLMTMKEAVVASFKVLFWHFLERSNLKILKETLVMISCATGKALILTNYHMSHHKPKCVVLHLSPYETVLGFSTCVVLLPF
jgi:hypothetical protein